MITWTVARIGHTVVYAYEAQPHRAICWLVAVVSVFCLGLNGVIGVFI
jgi:uncharacterized MAPEG superfamily protein